MQRKIFYMFPALISAVLVLTGLLYGYSQVIVFFKTGADSAEIMLPDSDKVKLQYRPQLEWVSSHQTRGRTLEKATIEKVLDDYVAASFYLFENNKADRSIGLKDYYTKDTRAKLVQFASLAEKEDHQYEGTTISHRLTPRFYSADGTLMVLSDEQISYHRSERPGEVYHYYDTSRYEVMLLLEDNYWRIRHKVRQSYRPSAAPLADKESAIQIKSGQFMEGGQPFTLKAMNYYPQDHPWNEMWQNFDAIDFSGDFKLIRSLGFNAIRIFVQYDEFGADQVSKERTAQLQQLLDEAAAAELKVIVTLFDFFLGYDLNTWTLSDQHLRGVVDVMKDHPALFAWDLKNEPDLDFEQSGELEVMEWLRFIALRLKTYDPHHFLTIGWSQPEHAARLASVIDFRSFHFYRDPQELATFLTSQSATAQPLFVGEMGTHSFNGWWFPFRKSQSDQQEYVADLMSVINQHEVSYGFWTLYDFRNVPSNVAGSVPWRRNPQKHFGLIDSKGRQKQVYRTILQFNCDEEKY